MEDGGNELLCGNNAEKSTVLRFRVCRRVVYAVLCSGSVSSYSQTGKMVS